MMHRSCLIPMLTLALLATPWQHAKLAHGQVGGGGFSESHVLLAIAGDPLTDPEKFTVRDEQLGKISLGIDALVLGWHAMEDEEGKLIRCSLRFQYLSVDRQGNTIGRLTTQTNNRVTDEAQASKVLELVQQRLQQTLLDIHRANLKPLEERLRRAAERRDRTEAEADHATSVMQSIRRQLIQADAVPEGLDKQLADWKQNRLTLQVELAGLRASRRAILEHIEEANVKLRDTQEAQAQFLSQLREIVQLRQQQLEVVTAQYKSAAASVNDVSRARVELATAQADLAARRGQIGQQADSGQLGRLNEQLVNVQIAMAAAEAQVEVIEQALSQLESDEVQKLVDRYRQASRQLEYALAAQQTAAESVSEAEETLRAVREPKITVIQKSSESE